MVVVSSPSETLPDHKGEYLSQSRLHSNPRFREQNAAESRALALIFALNGSRRLGVPVRAVIYFGFSTKYLRSNTEYYRSLYLLFGNSAAALWHP